MIPDGLLTTMRKNIAKVIPVLLSLFFFIEVTFILFNPDSHGFSWIALCLAAFFLFLLTVLHLFVKKPTLHTFLLPGIMLMCIFGNILYFHSNKNSSISVNGISSQCPPSIKRLPSNTFTAFIRMATNSEAINLFAGLYPYLNGNTLMVSPGQLRFAGLSAGELLGRRMVKEIWPIPRRQILTFERAESLLNFPHVEWVRLDGDSFFVILPDESPVTFYLASYNNDWYFLPPEYVTGNQ